MGQRRVVYSVLEEKGEGKGVLGRDRLKWEIIVRWNFRKLNWGYRNGVANHAAVTLQFIVWLFMFRL
jgi:hypothetical protein